jgi:drug/metabolite transporter (DMT)-like permease
MTPPLSTAKEIGLILLSSFGATGWYIANRRFVAFGAARADDVPTGERHDRMGAYGIIAPACACVCLFLAIWAAVLPADVGGFASVRASGVLLTALAGVLIGVYYRMIALAISPQYGGLGVFAVSYYVPLLGLTALAGFFLGDKPPTGIGWVGLAVALPAIVLIRWTKPDKPSDPSASPRLGQRFLVFSCVVGTSFGWLYLQRLVLGRRDVYAVAPGAFCVICLAFAPLVVLATSPNRPMLLRRILAFLRVPGQLRLLVLGGASLAVMYIGIAIELVHDLSRIIWLYYVVMIVILAIAGHFYLREKRDRLRSHQWLGIGLALLASVLISLGKAAR